jgi:hypothetical protein
VTPEVTVDNIEALVKLLTPVRVLVAPPLPRTIPSPADWPDRVRAVELARGLVTGPDFHLSPAALRGIPRDRRWLCGVRRLLVRRTLSDAVLTARPRRSGSNSADTALVAPLVSIRTVVVGGKLHTVHASALPKNNAPEVALHGSRSLRNGPFGVA